MTETYKEVPMGRDGTNVVDRLRSIFEGDDPPPTRARA